MDFEVSHTTHLTGEITPSGSKNASLPILAGTLLARGKFQLHNLPRTNDTFAMLQILEFLGAEIQWENNSLIINTENCNEKAIPQDLCSSFRGSIYLLGALLSTYKEAKIGIPGGDEIGPRPIDLHLKSFRKLGVTTESDQQFIKASLQNQQYKQVWLDLPSLGATCNLLLLAARGSGETIILNAAKNPEIVALARFLNSLGANIRGAGSSRISIVGTQRLFPTECEIMPDYLEAGTFCIACAITGGQVRINKCDPSTLIWLLEKLDDMGVHIQTYPDSILVERKQELNPAQIITGPYPSFHTDLQQLMVTLMTQIEGTSIVEERVFPKRFTHIDALKWMGADIQVLENKAIINGKTKLSGGHFITSDIRGGMSLILAGLVSSNPVIISNSEIIQRGYENLPEKFSALGAIISQGPIPKRYRPPHVYGNK